MKIASNSCNPASNLNKAISLSKLAVWDFNLDTKQLILDGNWESLIESSISKDNLVNHLYQKLPKKERTQIVKKLNTFRKKRINSPYTFQYRILNNLGEFVYMRANCQLLLNENTQEFHWIGSTFDITPLIITKNKIVQKNKYLKEIVNSFSDIIYEFNSDYQIINHWVSNSHEFYPMVKNCNNKFVHQVFPPHVSAKFKSLIDQTLETKSTHTLKHHAKKSNKYFEGTTNLISWGDKISVAISIKDISEKIVSEQKIKEHKTHLTAILKNSINPIWVIDPNKNLIFYNNAFKRLYAQLSDSPLNVGHPINATALSPELLKQWKYAHTQSLKGISNSFKRNITLKNNSEIIMEFYVNPFISENNEKIGSVMSGRDITPLFKAIKSAQDALLLKTKFVSTVSHEIRTPLNAIVGTIEHLQEHLKFSEFDDDIQVLASSSSNLQALINNILDFTKLESGEYRVNLKAFNLLNFLKTITKMVSNLPKRKHVQFVTNFQDCDTTVVMDNLKLHQIILNLLNNAIKFTHSGFVKLDVTLQNNPSEICLKITDTGSGIPKNDISTIFEPFTQSKSQDNFQPGTGLGLTITKQLTDVLGGSIDLKSEKDRGTTFTVVIPFKEDKSLNDSFETIQNNHKSFNNLHVLLAEDNLINAKLLKRTLEKNGATVTHAINGKEALEEFQNNQFDIVLLDIQMPVMDGFKAAHRLRKNFEQTNTTLPIFAFTAQPYFQDDPQWAPGLFDDFILKPFDLSEFKQKLHKVNL